MDSGTLLIGMTLSILIAAITLTVPASIALLRLYRRAVLKGMRTTTGKEEDFYREEPVQPAPAKPQLKAVWLEPDRNNTPNQWLQFVEKKQARLAIVYATAGLAYLLIFTISFLLSDLARINLPQVIVLLLIQSWPLIITTNMMLARNRQSAALVVGVYITAFSVLLLFMIAIGLTTSSVFEFWLSWIIFNIPPYIVLQMIVSRPIRSVGPIVFSMMLAIAAGIIVPLSILGPEEIGTVFNLLSNILSMAGLESLTVVAFILLFCLIGLAVAVPLGLFFIRRLGQAYRAKRISDQFILDDVVWLIYTAYWTLMLISDHPAYAFIGLASFLAYKTALSIGLRLTRDTASRRPPSMLLLRVFSLGEKSDDLYDRLSKFWRYLGTIQFILGPDLLKSALQPHRLIEYLSGKLQSRIVNSRAALDQRIKELDSIPDPDGRYRINDFLCQDNTWKMALRRLVNECDVILIDLRSFSQSNAGCQFEVKALIQYIPLRRVIFIVDETTKMDFLQKTMKEAWDNLDDDSPNALGNGEVYLLKYDQNTWKDFYTLIQTATGRIPA